MGVFEMVDLVGAKIWKRSRLKHLLPLHISRKKYTSHNSIKVMIMPYTFIKALRDVLYFTFYWKTTDVEKI